MIARLEQKRVDDAVWESPFEEAKDIANTHDIDPSFPRRASRHNSTVRMFLQLQIIHLIIGEGFFIMCFWTIFWMSSGRDGLLWSQDFWLTFYCLSR